MCIRHSAVVQHYANAIYIINALIMLKLKLLSPSPYYYIFMPTKSALSQPHLQLYVARMQACKEITESGEAGGEQSEPPVCILY